MENVPDLLNKLKASSKDFLPKELKNKQFEPISSFKCTCGWRKVLVKGKIPEYDPESNTRYGNNPENFFAAIETHFPFCEDHQKEVGDLMFHESPDIKQILGI